MEEEETTTTTTTQLQPDLQSIFIGLIFCYLFAKLISIVLSFKDNNLSLTRHHPRATTSLCDADDAPHLSTEADSRIAEQGSVDGKYSDDDGDDWEGLESTELDEAFSAASAFVGATAAVGEVSSEVQLRLYGLYKIATEGPCSAPPPSGLKITAQSKWQAWQRLGAMPPEDAMHNYIHIVTDLFPSWASASMLKSRRGDDDVRGSEANGPMGPVFSTFVYQEEEFGNELKMDAVHAFSREGEVDNLLKCIDSGVDVNSKDSEGRTPLHWAVDRGHLNIVEALIEKIADVNAKDNEGQTPLHYAAVCEREAIAEFLVKHEADVNLKDADGNSAIDLCELDWPCLQSTVTG